MSDAESEAYKAQREFDKELKLWEEQRKLKPKLADIYDSFKYHFDEIKKIHRKQEEDNSNKLEEVKREILKN